MNFLSNRWCGPPVNVFKGKRRRRKLKLFPCFPSRKTHGEKSSKKEKELLLTLDIPLNTCERFQGNRHRAYQRGNRSSRPKLISLEVMSPGTRVMLPEIHSHVARNFIECLILKKSNNRKE